MQIETNRKSRCCRRDVKMEVFDHGVIVRIWQPPREVTHYFPWDADNAISQLVYELNHGNYAIKVNYRPLAG